MSLFDPVRPAPLGLHRFLLATQAGAPSALDLGWLESRRWPTAYPRPDGRRLQSPRRRSATIREKTLVHARGSIWKRDDGCYTNIIPCEALLPSLASRQMNVRIVSLLLMIALGLLPYAAPVAAENVGVRSCCVDTSVDATCPHCPASPVAPAKSCCCSHPLYILFLMRDESMSFRVEDVSWEPFALPSWAVRMVEPAVPPPKRA